jgi:hypothetical protein
MRAISILSERLVGSMKCKMQIKYLHMYATMQPIPDSMQLLSSGELCSSIFASGRLANRRLRQQSRRQHVDALESPSEQLASELIEYRIFL